MTGGGSDFVVLTGFLGSGKTTLLRDFLARPEAAETAVIVNEVGEIGLDGVILRESGTDVPMAMLSNGCICCQMGSDLAFTVDALLSVERPYPAGPLRRIILETSGLSKPGPVLRQLGALAEHRMRVSVVATYDPLRGGATSAFEEAAAQWAAAHRIVVTKTDAVPRERLAEAEAEIRGLNPLAEIVAASDRGALVTAAFAPLAPITASPAPLPPSVREVAHPRVCVCLARPTRILAYDDLAAWLDNLAGALGDRLLRVKGLVRVAESERPLLVQSVGTMFSQPRPFGAAEESTSPFVVIIARDVEAGQLETVAPAGAFLISARSEPTAFSRASPRRGLRAEPA